MAKKKIVEEQIDWQGPTISGREPLSYATGTKVVRGKLEWVWKPWDAKAAQRVADRMAATAAPVVQEQTKERKKVKR